MIPKDLKLECIKLKEEGTSVKKIYKEHFLKGSESTMSLDSFRRKLNYWKRKYSEGEPMVEGFRPRWGTVHYDADGKIIQEWVRGDNKKDWQEEILDAISNVQVAEVEFNPEQRLDKNTLLEIPLFDMHFGVATFDHYLPTLREVGDHICRGHDAIVFAIGSDLFHNNDHRGRTAKGTPIEKVDMEKAFDDAAGFYVPLIRLAIKHSNSVEILYIKGNHDETPSWYFCKYLEALFPDVPFDLRFVEKKVFTWRKIFIGYTHGDKGKNAIPYVFIQKWPMEWAESKVREIHTGHIHTLKEGSKDTYGTRIRTLPTAGITDEWSEDNSYEGAVKEFNLFEYAADRIKSVHSVYARGNQFE